MKRIRVKFSHYLLGCLAGLVVCAIVVELGCRMWILSEPPPMLRFRAGLPQFEFSDSVPTAGALTIGSKREIVPRGTRAEKAALVGDAVTACAQISDSDCFSEKLQAAETRFDIYNFGVPGYGLPEVEAIVEGLAASAKFSTVIYLATANDVVDSMPLLLSLRSDPRYRYVNYEDYDQTPYASLRSLAREFYKAAILMHHFGWLETHQARLETPAHAQGKNSSRVPATACAVEARSANAVVSDGFDKKSADVMKRIYSDEKVLTKLDASYERLAAAAKHGGLRLVVVPFYDRELMEEGQNYFEPALKRAATRPGLELVDSRTFFSEHASDCGFYLDGDAVGFATKGSERFATWLEKNVLSTPLTTSP